MACLVMREIFFRGVLLVPLDMPWNRLIDFAPERFWPSLAAAPAANFLIILAICRCLRRKEDSRTLPPCIRQPWRLIWCGQPGPFGAFLPARWRCGTATGVV